MALTIDEITAYHERGDLPDIVVRSEDVLRELPAVCAPRERLKPFMNGLSTCARYMKAEREITAGEPCRLYCGEEFLGVCVLDGGEYRWTIRLNENKSGVD